MWKAQKRKIRRITKTPSRLFLLFLFSAFPLFPCSAFAQRSVASLDDADFAVRREATEVMLRDESLTAEAVAALLPEVASLELRQRLELIARHHLVRLLRDERFAAEGPGSIGVVQSVQAGPPYQADPDPKAAPAPITFALVTRVLPGFPAAGRLRPLDRIVAVDGQPLTGPANAPRFEDLMRRYRANQTISLTVERGPETLDLQLTLANGEALAAMYAFPDFGLTGEFDRAWTTFRQTHFNTTK